MGPVSQHELETHLKNQVIPPTARVWKQGMSDWAPANHVLSVGPAVAGSAEEVQTDSSTSIYAAPASGQLRSGDGTIDVPIKRANFALMLFLLIIGFIGVIAGAVLLGVSEEAGRESLLIVGGSIIAVSLVPLLWGSILSLIYLYRCWLIVDSASNGTARTTPGQAVGFCFIPFFNLYWIFQAYYGWARDYNVEAQRHGWQNEVPEGLFQAYCVLTVLGIVPIINNLTALGQIVVAPIMYYQMCQTINYHANC